MMCTAASAAEARHSHIWLLLLLLQGPRLRGRRGGALAVGLARLAPPVYYDGHLSTAANRHRAAGGAVNAMNTWNLQIDLGVELPAPSCNVQWMYTQLLLEDWSYMDIDKSVHGHLWSFASWIRGLG
jgi:hypothetical protein